MSEDYKTILRRWVEVWNEGNVDAVDEFVTDTYVRHDPNAPEVRGIEAEKQLMAMNLSALPDLRFAIEDMVAEGDKVVLRWTCHGTHKGELLGIPPTDKQVTISGTDIFRLAEGKPRYDAAARRYPRAGRRRGAEPLGQPRGEALCRRTSENTSTSRHLGE